MCDTKVFWKTQARVWHCRNDSTFLAHFPPTIIWKPCEITFKEDLHMGHLFPSFLPTENSNLLFYFYYKTGLQKKPKKNQQGKTKPAGKQGSQASSLSFSAKLEGISQPAAATSPDGYSFHLLLPSSPAETTATGATPPKPERNSLRNVHVFWCQGVSNHNNRDALDGYHSSKPQDDPQPSNTTIGTKVTFCNRRKRKASWPRCSVNVAKTSNLGLDTDYRKNNWGVGPGYSKLLNKTAVLSCFPALG